MNVSIVIICHHDRGFLQAAIESAEAQNFTGTFEIVVQMDSSKSMPENTNAGVKRAKGEYVKWLHDDDLLLPGCLTYLWRGYGADVIVGDVINFGEDYDNEEFINNIPDSLDEFVFKNPINQAGVMYKRQVLIDNPLDETLWTAEEYELNLRLFQKGYTFKKVDKFVSKYRVHAEMKSGSAWAYPDPEKKLLRRAEIERIQNIYR